MIYQNKLESEVKYSLGWSKVYMTQLFFLPEAITNFHRITTLWNEHSISKIWLIFYTKGKMCKQGKNNMEKVEHYRWMWRQAGRNITVIENKAYAMGIFKDGGQAN